jgi:hypothetical protein
MRVLSGQIARSSCEFDPRRSDGRSADNVIKLKVLVPSAKGHALNKAFTHGGKYLRIQNSVVAGHVDHRSTSNNERNVDRCRVTGLQQRPRGVPNRNPQR